MAEVQILSHWSTLIEGFQFSSQAFYADLEDAIERREIPKAARSRVSFAEGGLLSAKREYFRVQRLEFTFDICAAPFGTGFFISSWLFTKSGCMSWLAQVPVLGFFFRSFVKPVTYWFIDSGQMFHGAVHAAVLEVLDNLSKTKGARALSELERKPIMKELFGKP